MFGEAADYDVGDEFLGQGASESANAAARQNLEPRQNGDNVFGGLVKTSTQGALVDFVSRNGAPFDAANLRGDESKYYVKFGYKNSNRS